MINRARFFAALGLAGVLTVAFIWVLGLVAPLKAAERSSLAGCGVGVAGSYNAGVVADTLGAEGPGLHVSALCDLAVGKIIVGARGEWGWRRFEWAGVDIDVDGYTVLGRLGYDVNGVLPYVLAGWTALEGSSPFGSVDLDGAVVGAGVEIPIGNGLFGQIEGQYAMLEPDIPGFDEDVNQLTLRGGLVLKFGGNLVDAPPFKDYVAPKPLK